MNNLSAVEIIGLLLGSGILVSVVTAIFKVGKFSQKIESMGDTLTKVEDGVGETRGAIIEMQDTFSRLGFPMQRIVKTASPIILTDFGKKLVEQSGFTKIFSENKDEIVGWITQMGPKTEYDVQEFSRGALLKQKDNQIFGPLKEYAFNHGETSLEQILRAGSIIVRDEVIGKLGLK